MSGAPTLNIAHALSDAVRSSPLRGNSCLINDRPDRADPLLSEPVEEIFAKAHPG